MVKTYSRDEAHMDSSLVTSILTLLKVIVWNNISYGKKKLKKNFTIYLNSYLTERFGQNESESNNLFHQSFVANKSTMSPPFWFRGQWILI